MLEGVFFLTCFFFSNIVKDKTKQNKNPRTNQQKHEVSSMVRLQSELSHFCKPVQWIGL